jgi:proline iminopeptidase
MDTTGSIEIDGFKLRYRTEGAGPDALVLGSAIYYSRSFSQSLRKSLRLHFVDYRGFAQPPVSGIGEIPSFDKLVDDIEHMRKKLSLEKCIVVGHSAHALLALEYSKKYPQHVSHLVMIGISPSFSPEHAKMAERNWDESVWPERKAALAERMREFPDEKLSKLPPDQAFIKWNVRRAPQSWFDFRFDSSALWQGVFPNMPILDFFYGKALRDIDISKGLEAFNRPVLLALGRFDYIIAPASCWDPLRPKFQYLIVKIFERSGHSPQYEEPDLFNEELLKWLA